MFDLTGKVAVITGGAGLLGKQHAEAIAEFGGIPIILDVDRAAYKIASKIKGDAFECNVTNERRVKTVLLDILDYYGRVDILINNVSCNANLETLGSASRVENFSLDNWNSDLQLGLTSAFVCSKEFGTYMANNQGGVIVNIASDLSVIAPDQRLYQKEGIDEKKQPVKPVTYSVVKHGIIGLTKYLAAYWAGKVRVNAISPGGIFNNQPEGFVNRVSQLIPMERMANANEMQGALIFLCSDASSYMTGQNIIVDGGRTII